MKKIFYISFLIMLFRPGVIISQSDTAVSPLISYLEANDVSFLWKGELSQENRLGFIGEDYQRLEIYFISVIQNFDNPFEYFVYGKSRVRENICEFQGAMVITEAGLDEDPSNEGLETGFLKGQFLFYEDPSCLHSGMFQGEFFTDVYFDGEGNLYYNDLNAGDSQFRNNSFIGAWFDYNSNESLESNWGDHRIPYSEGLDVGGDSFQPSFKYLDSGWKEYLDVMEGKKTGTTWWK